ncbi:MAG TPA: ABC transporter permease, partial [Candidatus Dormibacteraeota bacterium]|nr:ABC transporter permease [Candidatus Dormibacteraeota bacterium]
MRYVLRKLALLVPVLFVVTVFTFLLIHLLPGSPCYAILKANTTPANLAKCNHQLHLDQSMPVQYWDWLHQSFTGNLGQSYLNDEPVRTAIAQALPVTLEIMIFSQLIALAVAIPLGVLAGYRPET